MPDVEIERNHEKDNSFVSFALPQFSENTGSGQPLKVRSWT